MADSPISSKEMAPTKKGANKGEEVYTHNSVVNNLFLIGKGRLRSPAASSAPKSLQR